MQYALNSVTFTLTEHFAQRRAMILILVLDYFYTSFGVLKRPAKRLQLQACAHFLLTYTSTALTSLQFQTPVDFYYVRSLSICCSVGRYYDLSMYCDTHFLTIPVTGADPEILIILLVKLLILLLIYTVSGKNEASSFFRAYE